MKVKKLLAVMTAAALVFGTALTASAAPFDAAWYAAQNPDVVKVYGTDPAALKKHYDDYGKHEHRMSSSGDVEAQLRRMFNAKEYAERYPDIKAAFGDNEEAMFRHYINYGLLEARRPSDKVSYETAVTLRKTVSEALTEAGLSTVPGQTQLAAVLTGNVSSVRNANMRAALNGVQESVSSAVNTAATAPAPSSGGGSSGSSGSSSNSGSSGHKHSYTETITKEATCTEAGSKTLTCSCGDTKTVAIPASHDFSVVKTAAVAATCTAAGKAALMQCSRCDATSGGGTVGSALGHNYSWVTDAAAHKQVCSRCGDETNSGSHTGSDSCTTCGWTSGGSTTACSHASVTQSDLNEAILKFSPSYYNLGYGPTSGNYPNATLIEVEGYPGHKVYDFSVGKINYGDGKVKVHCNTCGENVALSVSVSLDKKTEDASGRTDEWGAYTAQKVTYTYTAKISLNGMVATNDFSTQSITHYSSDTNGHYVNNCDCKQ